MPKLPPVHKPTRYKHPVFDPTPIESKRIRGRARQERNARLASKAPLCVMCEREGVVKVAEEWDHIVPLELGGSERDQNLQGLCQPHHSAKTAREAAERAKRKGRGVC